jgi:hypothetical protein
MTADELTDLMDRAGIHRLTRPVTRPEAVYSLTATVPGERWEIDLMDDGTVETEVFASTGFVSEAYLRRLIDANGKE